MSIVGNIDICFDRGGDNSTRSKTLLAVAVLPCRLIAFDSLLELARKGNQASRSQVR